MASPITEPPILSKRELDDINKGLALLQRAVMEIDRAEAAGVEPDEIVEMRARREHMADRFSKLKAAFFADQR